MECPHLHRQWVLKLVLTAFVLAAYYPVPLVDGSGRSAEPRRSSLPATGRARALQQVDRDLDLEYEAAAPLSRGQIEKELAELEEEDKGLEAGNSKLKDLPNSNLETKGNDQKVSDHEAVLEPEYEMLGAEMGSEGETEDYGDITQPEPSEFLGQILSDQKPPPQGKLNSSNSSGTRPSTPNQTSAAGRPPQKQSSSLAVEEEPLVMPDALKESLQRGIDAHGNGESMPTTKNTTTQKATPITEERTHATEEEEETLETLEDLQEPVEQTSLDSSLATEKAMQELRLEEQGQLPQSSPGMGGNLDGSGEGEPGAQKSSSEEPQQGGNNSSIMTQGAILGNTIKDMVKDNSSHIAGALAIMLAIIAGAAVACAGIAIYRRVKGRKDGKQTPRIIEIGSFAQAKKSPNYSRVGGQNQDSEGTSGAQWHDMEDWDELTHRSSSVHRPPGIKQKKAWDWDADW